MSKKAEVKLNVTDYTESVAPLIDFLQKKLNGNAEDGIKKKLCISDVVDKNGKRYVDLVLEGGGVLGIALAGYTYVLEKMDVAFMKAAGTSAGSINLLLLTAVTTKSELALLKQNKIDTPANSNSFLWDTAQQYDPSQLKETDYYDTRSEKLLEYLAAKDLSDLVDGHPSWRALLLALFQGKVDLRIIKNYVKKLGRRSLLWVVSFLFLFAAGSGLALMCCDESWHAKLSWTFGISASVFVLILAYLLWQVMKGRLLYKFAERFGINPGLDFEDWIKGILEENGIKNVPQLKSKLQQEYESLMPHYETCCKPKQGDGPGDKIEDIIDWINKNYDVGVRLGLPEQVQDIEDDLDDITDKLINIAEKIDPDAEDRKEQVEKILLAFTKVNELRYREHKRQTQDAKVPVTPFGKEIAMVSSDVTNQVKVEFPAMHKMYWGENFNISPAKYVRASMSIPFFFNPFQVDYDPGQRDVMEQEWRTLMNMNKRFEGNDKYALMVDGGMLSNFPVNIFYNPDSPLPLKPTIGVKLEFEDDAKSTHINSLQDLGGSMITTMRYFYDRDFINKHNMFKKTVRSIDTGDINWLNFALDNEEKVELFFRGALTAAIFLIGSGEEEDRARDMQYLKSLGSNVKLSGDTFSIYPDKEHTFFLTEDNNLNDVRFDWCTYKEERIAALGRKKMMTNKIKSKAGFYDLPKK